MKSECVNLFMKLNLGCCCGVVVLLMGVEFAPVPAAIVLASTSDSPDVALSPPFSVAHR